MTYERFSGRDSAFYIATDDTAELVNLAIALGRPILVEGEAGCGKTTLARAIADELGLGEPVSISVKSTSRAKDLLYRFDALRRLQDSQSNRSDKAKYIFPYLSLQPLGLAIHSGTPCVILIDEIDKADIDFPNDLLDVLGDFQFDIDEFAEEESDLAVRHLGFGRRVRSRTGIRPIVVITSNREKELPEPLLRRCLYLQLSFPDDVGMLSEIVAKSLKRDGTQLSQRFLEAAARKFAMIRAEAKTKGYSKPPSTSELIDWVKVLLWDKTSIEAIEEPGLAAPHWRILLKTINDITSFKAAASGSPR